MERAQKRVLRNIFSLVLAGDPGRNSQHDVAMTCHQALERAKIPAQGVLHQEPIICSRPFTRAGPDVRVLPACQCLICVSGEGRSVS
jgi:hypothetical protein